MTQDRLFAPSESTVANALIDNSGYQAMYDASIADAMRILYGGSMKSENASDLLSEPDIDGGLIGGASLHACLLYTSPSPRDA